MGNLLAVMMGGAAGSAVRYLIGGVLLTRFSARFPWGIWVVNVTGCFLIGLAMTLLADLFDAQPKWRYLLVVGFLGGYTTFSSYEWDSYVMARSGQPRTALLYLVLSVAAGYGAVWMGAAVGQRR